MEAVVTNLPLQLTSFIGRDHELAEIKRLLAVARLVTLTGPGGSGKTRLALEAASNQLGSFKEGVWLAELAPLSEPSLIAPTLASLFHVGSFDRLPPEETLKQALYRKNVLLVLDNCEHLIQGCARLVESLLQSCPDLRILVTSREALNVAGETRFSVFPLAFPDPKQLPPFKQFAEMGSVRLFVDRARATQPDFELTSSKMPAIAEICERLDGMPLAIELAAARVKTLGLEELRARLHSSFDLLTGGNRTALPRHQALRATIDWSYELLTPSEQALFRRLSVFTWSWTLEAAEVVCGVDGKAQVLDLLSRLIDKSLVIAEERETGLRYRFLDVIRQYAGEKLIAAREEETWRNRHLQFYTTLVESARPHLYGPAQLEWLDRLEAEHNNLRAALGWAIETGDAVAGLQLAAPLLRFWFLRGYMSEGSEWLKSLLALMGDSPTPSKARALFCAAELSLGRNDLERASRLGEQGLAIFQELHDPRGSADALMVLGVGAHKGGDRVRAADLLGRSIALYREIGFQWGMAVATTWLADVQMRQGKIEPAAQLWAQSLALFRALGDEWGIAFALGGSGDVTRLSGHYEQAVLLFREALITHRKLGHRTDIPYLLEALALAATALGRPRPAAHLWGAAETWRASIHAPIPESYQTDYAASRARAQGHLGSTNFAVALAEGRTFTLDQALREADALISKGPGARPEEAREVAGLTTREVEVLRLLAGGLSDRQIADRLVLSKRTVHAHLRSIYGKLNVPSRSAATRAAIDRKMV